MSSVPLHQPRLSSDPWRLYQAEHLSLGGQRGTREGFYGQMLVDDLGKLRYAYEISFVPSGLDPSRAPEQMYALLSDFDHTGYRSDPAALVCDFVNELLKETADGGALLLELYWLRNSENAGRRNMRRHKVEEPDGAPEFSPSLGLIPGWAVKDSRPGYSQVLSLEQQTIRIPRKRVQRMELSRRNRSAWRQSLRRLRLVDANKLLDEGVERFSWEGYSFSEVVEAQNMAVAASTAAIGWDGRGVFADAVTSPYMTFRRLRFTKFWVSVLEEAVNFLNQFTTSEALYGQEAFSFSLGGLPTTAELAQAMDGVRNGTMTVDKARDSFLFPKYNVGGLDVASDG